MNDPKAFDSTADRRRSAAAAGAVRAIGTERGEHPPYEALAAVVDGNADDVAREIVESHAAACPTCAAELQDLRAFAGRGAIIPRWTWWAAAAAVLVAIVAVYVLRPHRRAPAAPQSASLPAEWSALVSAALQSGKVQIPADIRALAAGDAFRGNPPGDSNAVSVEPSATAVDETSPLFRWSAVGAASDYQVIVYDDLREVARSAWQRETSWLCSQTLERGKTYRWQVAVRRGHESLLLPSPPAPPAIFRVLGLAQHEELVRAETQVPHDDLLLGILYARAGVLDRARLHLLRYSWANTSSRVARKLLDSLDQER